MNDALGFEIETHANIFKIFGFAAGVLVSFLGFKFSVKTFIVEVMAQNDERISNADD